MRKAELAAKKANETKSTNPKNVYRAYPLTAADREKLLRMFPPDDAAALLRLLAYEIECSGRTSTLVRN